LIIRLFLSLLLFALQARAQAEIDLFGRIPVMPGTHAAAMAGAYTAVANDYTGLHYNPAGLASMKRMELSVSARWSRRCNDAEFSGSDPVSTCDEHITLDHLGVAVPLPVYRGGVTIAAGYQHIDDFDQPYASSISPVRYDVSEDGGVNAWSFGFGVKLSRHFSGGMSLDLLRGTENYEFNMWHPDYRLREYSSLELTGTRLTLGGQLVLSRGVTLGATFRTPVNYRFTWNEWQFDSTNVPSGLTDTDSAVWSKYTFQTPLEALLGVAWQTSFLLLEMDLHWIDCSEASYRDYSEAVYNDANRTIRANYSPVTGVRLFAAMGSPVSDFMFRAGYAVYPFAGKVRSDKPRMLGSLGISWLVDEVIDLNLAIQMRTIDFNQEYPTNGTPESLRENRLETHLMTGFYYHF